MLRSTLLCGIRSFPLDHKTAPVSSQPPETAAMMWPKTAVAATCSAESAGTSSDSHSQCTVGGTALSNTPEPKLSGSLPSGSRSEFHYPNILQYPSNLYSCKKKRKLVRLMTVLAYVFAVSLVAIILSLYYLFLWDPYLHSSQQQPQQLQISNDTEGRSPFLIES